MMCSRLAVTLLAILAALLTAVTPALSALPKDLQTRASQSPHGIINLDSPAYNALINASPENRADFSVAVLLTALNTPGVACEPCKAFQPEYEAVAKAWSKSAKGWKDGKASHYFAQVEFMKGREVFQQLGLTHAPVLLVFPPGEHVSKAISYDYSRRGFGAAALSEFLSDALGKDMGYRKPFPWKPVLTFTLVAATVTAVGVFAITKFNVAMEKSNGPNSGIYFKTVVGWIIQFFSLALITIMCSGFMWNKIRGSAYMNVKPGGQIEYFAGGFQNQLGVETQIVATIYGVLAFSLVALVLLVPTQRDPVKQRAGVYVWSVILLAGVSVLFAIFRIKNPSYPFRLFL